MHMLSTGDYDFFPDYNFFLFYTLFHSTRYSKQEAFFKSSPFVITFPDVRTMKVCFILSFFNQTVYEPFSSEDDV